MRPKMNIFIYDKENPPLPQPNLLNIGKNFASSLKFLEQ